MKCKTCKIEIESVEIKGTLGMRRGYCCGELKVDIDSLRPKVKASLIEYEQSILLKKKLSFIKEQI